MPGFIGQIAVGDWILVSEASGVLEPLDERASRWRGRIDIPEATARALCRPARMYLLKTRCGLILQIARTCWRPSDPHAVFEFTAQSFSNPQTANTHDA